MATEKSARLGKSSLEDQIAATKAKLRELETAQRDQLRKEAERNTKAIAEYLKAEGLDKVNISVWKASTASLKQVLQVTP